MLYLSKAGSSRIWNVILAVFLWWQRQRHGGHEHGGHQHGGHSEYFPEVYIFTEVQGRNYPNFAIQEEKVLSVKQ